MAQGPVCASRSSVAHGARKPAVPAGTDRPPIDHWSIDRPQGTPLGLQTSVSDCAAGSPGRGRPGIGEGEEPDPVDGADDVRVPPAPKYRRVGVAPVNG